MNNPTTSNKSYLINTPITNKINEANVAGFYLGEDKKLLEIAENYYGYFNIALNKKEVLQLIEELYHIHNEMVSTDILYTGEKK